MEFPAQTSAFGGFNKSMFRDPFNGTEKRSIFGNDIPQIAKAKPDPSSSACCVSQIEDAPLPAGGFKMNAFYSTIWSHNLKNVLIKNMAFGESCCL